MVTGEVAAARPPGSKRCAGAAQGSSVTRREVARGAVPPCATQVMKFNAPGGRADAHYALGLHLPDEPLKRLLAPSDR